MTSKHHTENSEAIEIDHLIAYLDNLIYSGGVTAGDFAYADELYTGYKQRGPETSSARLLELRGMLCYLSGNYDDALFDFHQARNSFMEDEYFISNLAHNLLSQTESADKRKKNKWVIRGILGVAFLSFITYSYWEDSDAGVLARADPLMAAMADSAGMSDKGKATFLRADPVIVQSGELDTKCGSDSSEVVFGCYVYDANKIYIRDMPSEFDDLEIVTAAHEMLHAASYRHGIPDELVPVLVRQKERSKDDKNFKNTLEAYAELSRADQIEELHSIVGTELDQLPVSLTDYYETYFDERPLVLAANTRGLAVFDKKEANILKLERQLENTLAEANSYYGSHVYAAGLGDAYSADYYWSLYQSEFADYDKLYTKYTASIDAYNDLLEQYEGRTLEVEFEAPELLQ